MPQTPINLRAAFDQYLKSSNKEGSGKASSYLRAIDLLEEMLRINALGFSDCRNLWAVHSTERLSKLRDFVLSQQKKSDSPWYEIDMPKSYLRDGYCSAALSELITFLPLHNHAARVLEIVRTHQGDDETLAAALNFDPEIPQLPGQGQDTIHETKVRIGQYAFRQMILGIYSDRCCITGLNIPQINQASHIIPWAKSRKHRMDPRNGLCLSATYDAAFDKHLISFDEDYRLIVSRDILDHYTNRSVREHFHQRCGQKIELPKRHLPLQDFLAEHRSSGSF